METVHDRPSWCCSKLRAHLTKSRYSGRIASCRRFWSSPVELSYRSVSYSTRKHSQSRFAHAYLGLRLHGSSKMDGQLSDECERMLVGEVLVESIQLHSKVAHQVDRRDGVYASVLWVAHKCQIYTLQALVKVAAILIVLCNNGCHCEWSNIQKALNANYIRWWRSRPKFEQGL